MRIGPLLAWLLCVVPLSIQAQFGRTAFSTFDEGFTEAALLRGMSATQAQCTLIESAVWVAPQGLDGECIRFWRAGFQDTPTQRALFFFSGDRLNGNNLTSQRYVSESPATLQQGVERVSERLRVPYVFVARPGAYGSSGEHKQRRRAPESILISAALDEIKRRFAIEEIGVAGQSGGGHVVAALLGMRRDLVCAVPSSGVVAPGLRAAQKGWSRDSTGYADSYEPIDQLSKVRMNPALRVFVIGDPADANVPFTTQLVLADKLRALGVEAEMLKGEGTGPDHHGLDGSGLKVAAMCLRGESTRAILDLAVKGLKG